MNTVKDGYDVIKSLRPAPIDQTNVMEDKLLDLLFDGSRYIQEGHKAVGFINNLPSIVSVYDNCLAVSLIPNNSPEEEVDEWAVRVVNSFSTKRLDEVRKFEYVSLFNFNDGLVCTYMVTRGVVELQFHFTD